MRVVYPHQADMDIALWGTKAYRKFKLLEELGFESGSEINVECHDGKLIIPKKEAITE